MTVSTSNYEFTWGRKPSGKGVWAFQFFKGGKDTIEFFEEAADYTGDCWGEQTYAKAKRWAVAYAAKIGADRVAVAT